MRRINWKTHFTAIISGLFALCVGGAFLFGQGLLGNSAPNATTSATTCQTATPAPAGETFHVDPVHGTDGGDGSKKRPWRSLQRTIDAKLIGSQIRDVHPLQYWTAQLLRRQPPARLRDNVDAVVGDGDTILLASGHHGVLDLRGIANRAPVTIAGAAGANARFASMQIEGASQFTFANITVASPQRGSNRRYLIDLRPDPTARKSNNIVFRNLHVGGDTSISKVSRSDWAKKSNDGIRMFGDCLEIHASNVHDVHSGIVLYQVAKAKIENVDIRDFSVDGIDFSGSDIVLRENTIHDHWPTSDDLHPDCMQGQSAPNGPEYAHILIERNVCLSDTSSRQSERLQGISIFNGDWTDVTIRCNFVRPTMAHGISLYGVKSARIERNIVTGWPGVFTPWIASMPSKDQRDPLANTITANLSTGYINAIHGGPNSVAEMLKNLEVNPNDTVIQNTLSWPITGVTLRNNAWLNPNWDVSADKRFSQVYRPAYASVVSVNQAKAEIAAFADCKP